MINLKILFKNTTKYNKKIYKEFLEFHSEKFDLKYFLSTGIIAFILLFCIVLQIKYQHYVLASLFIIIIISFLAWRFLHPVSEVKKSYNSTPIQKEQELNYTFYEKTFKIREKVNTETINYRDLYKIFETKSFFYLYIDKTHSFLVDKNGFYKGSSDDFADFCKKNYWWKFKKEQ